MWGRVKFNMQPVEGCEFPRCQLLPVFVRYLVNSVVLPSNGCPWLSPFVLKPLFPALLLPIDLTWTVYITGELEERAKKDNEEPDAFTTAVAPANVLDFEVANE